MLKYCRTQLCIDHIEPNYHRLIGPHIFNKLCLRRYWKIEIVGEVFMLSDQSFHTLIPQYYTDCWVVVKYSYWGNKIFIIIVSYE